LTIVVVTYIIMQDEKQRDIKPRRQAGL